jgi:prefoldin subunit 5
MENPQIPKGISEPIYEKRIRYLEDQISNVLKIVALLHQRLNRLEDQLQENVVEKQFPER